MAQADSSSISQVEQLLRFHGFHRAVAGLKLDLFHSEEQPFSAVVARISSDGDVRKEFMSAFDTCNVPYFDWLWQRYLPAHVSIGDHAFFRTRFLCLLHFSALESRSGRSSAVQLLEADIKNFGDALARDASLVEFFVFPHVHAPSSHPSLSAIFKDEWRTRVREQLAAFLPQRISLPQPPRSPATSGADPSPPNSHVSQQISSLCGESLDMLLSLSNSLPFLDADELQDKRSRLTYLNSDAGLSSQANNFDFRGAVSRWVMSQTNASSAPRSNAAESSSDNGDARDIKAPRPADLTVTCQAAQSAFLRGEPVPLDFEKVRRDLATQQPMMRCLLLQALRFRLSMAPVLRIRRRALQQYIKFDVVGTLTQGDGQSSCLLSLLRHPNATVVDQAVHLVNVVASEASGRTYLLELPDIVPLLVAIIRSQSSDNSVRKNALGALQKFSLRSMPQNQMLKAGIVTWISGVLKDTDSLSDYTLEYAMATLMNLSLRHDGKVECEAPSLRLLESLCDLLEHENMQVRTYVNGTLYSLLTRQVFKDRAHALGLPEMLQCLADVSEKGIARQLQFILDQIECEAVDDDSVGDDGGDEENDEPELVVIECFCGISRCDQTDEDDEDLLETEVDTDVMPFKGIDTALKGEPFLAIEYASAPISFPPSLKHGLAPLVPPIQIDAVRFGSSSQEPLQGLPSPLTSARDTSKKRSQLNAPVTLSTPRLLRTSVSKSIMPSDSEPLSSARNRDALRASTSTLQSDDLSAPKKLSSPGGSSSSRPGSRSNDLRQSASAALGRPSSSSSPSHSRPASSKSTGGGAGGSSSRPASQGSNSGR